MLAVRLHSQKTVCSVFALLVAVISLGLPQAAGAASPPCSSEVVSAYGGTIAQMKQTDFAFLSYDEQTPIPTSLNVGKVIQFGPKGGLYFPSDDASDTMTFSWESAGGQLTYPQSRTYPATFNLGTNHQVMPIQFALGDGPGKIVVKKVILYQVPPAILVDKWCQVTYESAPIYPETPEIKLQNRWPSSGGDGFIKLKFNSLDCLTQKIVVQFRTGSQKRTISSGAQCTWPELKLDGMRGLSVYSRPTVRQGSESQHKAGGVFADYWASRRSKPRRFTYRVTIDGSVVKKGSLVFAMRYKKGRKIKKIWDYQFDDYVNVCINKNRRIHAKNGHLYCVRSYGREGELRAVLVKAT